MLTRWKVLTLPLKSILLTHFQDLTLTDFRNYPTLTLQLSSGINCFGGQNGSGKTNLLDAIHFLALTRGFRNSQDLNAVKEGETFFLTGANFMGPDGKMLSVQCNVMKGRGKKMLINRQPLDRMSEHIGRIPLVSILPSDTELIQGASAARRRFIDLLISQYDPAYLTGLIRYQRLLEQRNALLRQFAESGRFDQLEIQIWDEQLLQTGIPLLEARIQFLKELEPEFAAFFHEIVNERETPALRYDTALGNNTPESWRERYTSTLDRDRRLGHTAGGIHRDDLSFFIDGRQVRQFGSQGQQKTFVIALKLAEYSLLARKKGQMPVLLLDDIFDKLDEHRLAAIAAILRDRIGGQVFVTDTSIERLRSIFPAAESRPVGLFEVRDAQVHPVT